MAEPEPTPMRRRWRVLLTLSLVLNLALVGLIAGTVLRIRSDGPPRVFDLSLGPMGEALSREDRRAIVRSLRSGPGPLPRREDARAALHEITEALRADPFEPAALTAALDGARSQAQTLRDAAQAALVARIAAMTRSEREALADRLAEGLRRR